NDEIITKTEIAGKLIEFLKNNYCNALSDRYNIDMNKATYEVLADIAAVRGCLMQGSEYDLNKAAALLLEDFRSGKLGRISLEQPKKILGVNSYE
ncbi:MAG: ribosome biogenesis GTPase YlqF, partial [Wujia sp.]